MTVAALSAAAALVPIPGLSIAVDIGLILKEFAFYRSQLGLPKKGTAEFEKLHFATKEAVSKVCLTAAPRATAFLSVYAAESAVQEVVRFYPDSGFGDIQWPVVHHHVCCTSGKLSGVDPEIYKEERLN